MGLDQHDEKINLLVIDDKQANLFSIERLVERSDLNILKASSGNEALRMVLSDSDIALILCDVQMPGMDGFEFGKVLKTREQTQNIPIIFVSAIYTENAHFLEGYEAGGVDYLPKPIETAPLRNKVGVFVELHKQKKLLEKEISQRKKAEKAVQDARDKLEIRVQERTAELEKATRAKSDFLATMSHEIRTPMNGVIGMIDLLSKTDLDSKQKKFVNTIRSSADLLLTVINDILDFSKVEAGKLILEKTGFDFHSLVQETIDLLEYKATEKNLQLNHKIDQNVSRNFSGDQIRLRQILINLLNNAIKFTEKGSVDLSVSLDSKTEHDAIIRFKIKDTGKGLSPDQADQLFKPFTQIESASTRQFGGTGLGLAICKLLVELMDGEIGVESEKDVGSEFWFTACLELASATDIEIRENEEITLESFAGRNVLTVDDNAINQLVIQEMITFAGINCDLAHDGSEAVEMLSGEHGYDLVFMDHHMPVMDGLQATKLIRKNEAKTGKRVPIIAISADVMSEQQQIRLDAGMDDFIPKPFTGDDLLYIFNRWMRNR